MKFPEVFDSSIMSDVKTCPQLFFYSHIMDYKPKEPNVHLHAGAAFAKGVEGARVAFYVNNETAENSVAKGLSDLLTFYGDFECPSDSAKSAERMAGALEFYFERYPLGEPDKDPVLFPGGARGIEFSASHPLPVSHPETGLPIIYAGRLDAILNFAGGRFVTDEKTTTQLGATWSRQWDLRGQFTGYVWLCRESGIKVDGALIRGVSILKTKYDTQEAISYRPDWQVDRWLSELCEWLEEAKTWWKRKAYKHNLDKACADFGGCRFRQACMSEEDAPWLETYFERRHWDPVTRTETPLAS